MTDDDFFSEMADVKPLAKAKKVPLKPRPVDEITLAARRAAAAREEAQTAGDALSTAEIDLLDPWQPLEFRRPGVQHGVFRKFRLGQYQLDARLDLHGMTVEQARAAVSGFIVDAMAQDLRCLVIVHGKGLGPKGAALALHQKKSAGSKPVLKSYLNYWLPKIDAVQAFASAQPHHGGLGAVYVLLKKSEGLKNKTREQYSKGRVSG